MTDTVVETVHDTAVVGAALRRTSEWLYRAAQAVTALAMVAELLVLFGNAVSRDFFGASFLWSNEIAQAALTVMTFLGGAVAYWAQRHIAFRGLVDRLPARLRPQCDALARATVLGMSVLMTVVSVPVLASLWTTRSPVLQWRMTWLSLPLVVGPALIAVFAATEFVTWRGQARRRAVVAVVAVAVLLTAFGLAPVVLGLLLPNAALIVGLLVCLFCFLIGVPLGFVFMVAAFLQIALSGAAPIDIVSQQMLYGTQSFVLLAIPFFIVAGEIIAAGGLSRRLVRAVQAVLGRGPGSLGLVAVIASFVFSGMSGTKVADVAAVGSSLTDELVEAGYSRASVGALLAASAGLGETVPPSVALLVLASVSTLSVGTLFVAGIVPAMVVCLCLLCAVAAQGVLRRRRAGPDASAGGRQSMRTRVVAVAAGVPAAVIPVLLIAVIASGIASPTETSSFAVIYAVILTIIYRDVSLRQIGSSLLRASALAGMILFVLAAANAFSWMITTAGVAADIGSVVSALGNGKVVILVISVLGFIILGSVLEGLPALLLVAPLMMPVAQTVGINQLQYGILLVASMGVGAFMPPLGVGLYAACAVTGSKVEDTFRPMLPYLLVLLVGIFLIAAIPELTTFLPNLFGLPS
jgi:tripartite ATP-independent transporter DctM subunit